jgi:hypothetical protein
VRRQVAIIGAGVAGLAAAGALVERGLGVHLFEKSRGLGGRAATRRRDGMGFDHGAQYFTVRSPRFGRAVDSFVEAGLVAAWTPRIVRLRSDGSRDPAPEGDRFVGVPGMSSLGRALARDLPVRRGTRIANLHRTHDGHWVPVSDAGELYETFDAVIVTCPAPQAEALLQSVSVSLAAVCRSAVMFPCWAAMVAFESALDLDFDAAFVTDEALAWVSRESSKPGRRSRPECWTLHGAPEWSASRLEEEPGRVARELIDRFAELAGAAPRNLSHLDAHRWRFARSAEPLSVAPTVDAEARISIAGDWTNGDRLEGAWLSGTEAAESISELLSRP